jgi:uncharacterized protein involved in exopolysaccharide biosynthesis
VKNTSLVGETLTLLWRHRSKVAVTWIAIVVAGIAVAFLSPDVYRSEARLFVRLGRENVTLDPTATIGQGPLSVVPVTRDGEINSVVEILKGRTLVEQLVDFLTPEVVLDDQTGLVESLLAHVLPADETSDPRDVAIHKMNRKIGVNAIRKSNLISVTCDAHDPELARRAVDKYVELFLEQYRSLYRNPRAHDFFSEQAELLGARVLQTETKLLTAKNQAGLGAVDEQRRILLVQIGALEDEIRKTQTQIEATEAQLMAFEEKLETLPKTVVTAQTTGYPNVAADSIRQRLYDLQLKEKEYSAKMTDQHVMVKQVREELQAAQAIHEQEQGPRTQVTDSVGPAYQQIHLSLVLEQTNLVSHRARVAALEPQLAAALRRLAQINEAEIQVVRLQRQLELERTSHSKYADALEQVRVDGALEAERISNINVAQPGSRELKPLKPNRPVYLVLALCLATFAAVGLPLLVEPFGHAPEAPREALQRREIPALSSVPQFREMATLQAHGNGNGHGNDEGL